MKYGFYIGYIYGSIHEFDFEDGLGFGTNKRNSVGIGIESNGFYLDDEDHFNERLQCESADAPSSFKEKEQIWKISWDLIDRKMEISLKDQQRGFILMTHITMKEEHHDVVPAITLHWKDDSITLLTE